MKLFKTMTMSFIIGLWTWCLFADNSQFQVRLALDENEAQAVSYDTLPYTSPRGQEIRLAVGKDVILSAQDVQDASIRLQKDLLKDLPAGYWTMDSDGIKVLRYTKQDKLNLTAEPRIELQLTADGAQKLADFTKNNIGKSVAIIGNNRVLQKVMIMFPIEGGKLQIFSPTDKVNEMVQLVESMGLKLKAKPAI